MNKFLASASFIVLSSVTAFAADLPVSYKSPAPAIVPTYTWTGCYIGAHGGGGLMNDSNSNGGTSSFEGGSGGNNAFHGTGGIAGGQAGCNYQVTNVVFGIEGEGYWSGLKGNLNQSQNFFNFGTNVLNETRFQNNQTTNTSDYTIAGRIGIAFDRTLVYGKAGWAWGKFNASSNSGFTDFPSGFSETTALNWGGTLNGPLFGLGIEYLITNNWTVKLEYNYIAFGTRSFATTNCFSETGFATSCVGNGSSSGNTPLGADKQIFKFGVNYKFDWGPTAVIAKY